MLYLSFFKTAPSTAITSTMVPRAAAASQSDGGNCNKGLKVSKQEATVLVTRVLCYPGYMRSD